LVIREGLAKEDGFDLEIRRAVAQAHTRVGFRLAELSTWTGDKEDSRQWMENEQAALVIRKELADADPTNALDRRNLADQLMLTANAQVENGEMAAALNGYRSSLDIFKGLSSADLRNSEASRGLSFVYFHLAQANGRAGDSRAARAGYQEVIAIDRELLAHDPMNEEDLQMLAGTYSAMAQLSEKMGDLAGAIDNLRREVDVRERMVEIMPDNPKYALNLASNYLFVGRLYAVTAGAHVVAGGLLDAGSAAPKNAKQMQQWREARGWYQKSLVVFQGLKSKGTPEARFAPAGLASEISKCDAAIRQPGN